MLWRVQNTDKYFLGSIHLLPESDSELNVKIHILLPHMARVVFESDLSNAKEPDFATYRNGCHLQEILPADLYARCSQRWQELDIKAKLDSCKPWWAALLIVIGTAIKNGFSYERGVEQQLLGQVPVDRRAYLEAPDMAFLPFEQAPISEQLLQLELCCLGDTMIMAELTSLYRLWRASDLPALSQFLHDRMAILTSTYTALVSERNRMWAPEIVKFLVDPNPTLFVLGALHYVGPHKFPDCLNGPHEYAFQKVY